MLCAGMLLDCVRDVAVMVLDCVLRCCCDGAGLVRDVARLYAAMLAEMAGRVQAGLTASVYGLCNVVVRGCPV